MTTTPPLTRDIGQAERAMGALLEPLLDQAGLSFPEWTVLVLLESDGPLPRRELIRRQVDSRLAPEAMARDTVDRLQSSGLVGEPDGARGRLSDGEDENPLLMTTAAGQDAYQPVRRAVSRITGELYGDMPPAELDATRRTLVEITRRANARLAAASSRPGSATNERKQHGRAGHQDAVRAREQGGT